MIIIPQTAIAIAFDYVGDAKHTKAVYCDPLKNCVIPGIELVTNPVSKDFGQWVNPLGLRRVTNLQEFVAAKTKKVKIIWAINSNKTFSELWVRADGKVTAADVQFEQPAVEETQVAEAE